MITSISCLKFCISFSLFPCFIINFMATVYHHIKKIKNIKVLSELIDQKTNKNGNVIKKDKNVTWPVYLRLPL